MGNLEGFPNLEGSVYWTRIKKIDDPEEGKNWIIERRQRRQLKHLYSTYVYFELTGKRDVVKSGYALIKAVMRWSTGQRMSDMKNHFPYKMIIP